MVLDDMRPLAKVGRGPSAVRRAGGTGLWCKLAEGAHRLQNFVSLTVGEQWVQQRSGASLSVSTQLVADLSCARPPDAFVCFHLGLQRSLSRNVSLCNYSSTDVSDLDSRTGPNPKFSANPDMEVWKTPLTCQSPSSFSQSLRCTRSDRVCLEHEPGILIPYGSLAAS